MKTYSSEKIHWIKHHHPQDRDEYLTITSAANVMPPDFPRTVYLEVGARCNLNCTFCSKPTRRKFEREMDMDTIQRVIRECADNGTYYLTFHDFNEPLLHTAKLIPAIVYAKACGIPIVATTTNITPLTDRVMRQLISAGLDSLHLSFEGADPELYERVRGVRYNVIASRILHASQVRKQVDARDKLGRLRPWLAISMVRTVETDEQCTAFMERWKGIVDDIEVRPALEFLGRTNFAHAYVPSARIPCRYMGDRIIITADGTVTACSVDVDAALNLGNVLDGDTIRTIWHSDAYRDLWAKHQWEKWDDLPEPCKSCGSWDFTATQRSEHLQQTMR